MIRGEEEEEDKNKSRRIGIGGDGDKGDKRAKDNEDRGILKRGKGS